MQNWICLPLDTIGYTYETTMEVNFRQAAVNGDASILESLNILGLDYSWYQILITISAYLSMILSIASVIEYIYKNREVLYEE